MNYSLIETTILSWTSVASFSFHCLSPIYANSWTFLNTSYNPVHNLYITNNLFTVWSVTSFRNFNFFCCRIFPVLFFHCLFEFFLIWLLMLKWVNQSQHAWQACTTKNILEWWNAKYYSLFFADKAELIFAFWNVQSLRWTGAFNKIK